MKNNKKRAFITGVTGQDGSYLAEFLLSKDYEVFGLIRRTSQDSTKNLKDILDNPDFQAVSGDITDMTSLIAALGISKPDEVYHLTAQSHVAESFLSPVSTFGINAMGTLNLLEAIRITNNVNKIRLYVAGTSELYGNTKTSPQNEKTAFEPRSPYGVSKESMMSLCKNYSEAYGLWIARGILFNHTSPRRPDNFIFQKVTRGAVRIKLGLQNKLYLGNLNAKRDLSHSKDCVKCFWRMLQYHKPLTLVVGSGETHTIREMTELAFEIAGVPIDFKGEGLEEKGYCKKTGDILVEINPKFYRPAEVSLLLADASLAKKIIDWEPTYSFEEIAAEMVSYNFKIAQLEIDNKLI